MWELLEHLSAPWAIRAIITTSMVGITCGVLGAFIVLRNMSLIGDALAHAVLPGVFVSFLLLGKNAIGFFIGSVIAGVSTSFGITWIQQYVKTKNDAAIGIVFSSMFAIGVMGISKISERGVHLDLTGMLFGTVMGISNTDIILTFGVMLVVLLSIGIFYKYFFITTFQETIAKTMGIPVKLIHYFLMLLLSFAVVSALSSVGVILVVAMLITPAATALLISVRLKHVIILSALIGLISAMLGLIIAILYDTTPGPAMTVMVTLIYLLVAFFSPRKGLVFKYFRKRGQRHQVIREDILKYGVKQTNQLSIDLAKLSAKLNIPLRKIEEQTKVLIQQHLMQEKDSQYSLTAAGVQQANQLIRAHRLWESYLVQRGGMNEHEIHEEAERLEHQLSAALLDEVDASLGFPETDPHGSPIPKKKTIPLAKAAINKNYIIIVDQKNDNIDAQLWEQGILPNVPIKVIRKNNKSVELNYQGKRIRIAVDLAQQIRVQ